MAAEMLAADFVFVVMEVWGLPKDKMPRMDAIIDKYGSISCMSLPGRHGFLRP